MADIREWRKAWEREEPKRGGGWEEIATVSRSVLDPAVWVPNTREDDLSCFMHAGGIRAVKRWAVDQCVANGEQHRWARAGDSWELQVRTEATS